MQQLPTTHNNMQQNVQKTSNNVVSICTKSYIGQDTSGMTIDRVSTKCCLTIDRVSTDYWPTIDRYIDRSTDHRPTIDRVLTECRLLYRPIDRSTGTYSKHNPTTAACPGLREGMGKTFQALSAVIYCQQQDSESLPNCYQPGRKECGHVKLYWQINNWKAHDSKQN